jgi:hypothetical protein
VSESDLVEPEGVNAGSAEAMEDRPRAGDPVPGGDPAAAPEQQPPDTLVGPPPEPAGNADDVYGSSPPA